VDVIDTTRQIVLVAAGVLPEAPLPDRPFTAFGLGCGTPSFFSSIYQVNLENVCFSRRQRVE
jgi:hypothetical protein